MCICPSGIEVPVVEVAIGGLEVDWFSYDLFPGWVDVPRSLNLLYKFV